MTILRTAIALRLALLRGAVHGPNGTARLVSQVVGGLLGLAAAVGAGTGMAFARGHGTVPVDLATLLYTVLLLGWTVLPVLTFAADELLDPARLALLPLTGRALVTVMGVGSLIGIPAVTTVAICLAPVVGTAHGPVSLVVGVLAALLQAALCIALSRACTSALSRLLGSRRGRDLGVILVALVGVLFQVLNVLFQVTLRRRPPSERSLHAMAGVLRGTPPGWLAAAPGAPVPAALAALAGAGLLVLALLAWWERSVRRILTGTNLSSAATRHTSGLQPRRLALPAGRSGAIAAKDLRYLGRDPRRAASAATAVLLPVLVVLAPMLVDGGGLSGALVFAAAGVGLMGNITGLNRFGQDGSAVWLLVGSWTDPRDPGRDLAGGDVAVAWVMAPAVGLVGVLLAAVSGGWRYLPAALGLGYGVLLAGIGLSAMTAVHLPFAVPSSSDVFAGGGAGRGGTALAASFLALFGQLALCTPLIALLVAELVLPAPGLGVVLLFVGPAYGLSVLVVFRRIAADRWATRAPEILEAVTVRS